MDGGSLLTSRQKRMSASQLFCTSRMTYLTSYLNWGLRRWISWTGATPWIFFVPTAPRHGCLLGPRYILDLASVLPLVPHRMPSLWSIEETSTLYMLSPPFLWNKLSLPRQNHVVWLSLFTNIVSFHPLDHYTDPQGQFDFLKGSIMGQKYTFTTLISLKLSTAHLY